VHVKFVQRVKCLKRPRLRETDGNVYAAGYTKITLHTCANFNTRQRVKM